MNLNDIKKEIYKQQPKAYFQFIRMGIAYYEAFIKERFNDMGSTINVKFEIPVNDMGNADFFSEMEAKHLIRWIVIE